MFILPLDQVAVKVPSGLTTGSADLVTKDLTREIEVMASLDHPHIVKLYGITHSEWAGPTLSANNNFTSFGIVVLTCLQRIISFTPSRR